MPRTRVLLADDHRIFSEGLQRILESQYEVVGVSQNGRDLVADAQRLRPDVVVLDISMPFLNGIEATRRIQKSPHAPKIVVLTMHEDSTYATAAFQAGASGYVVKRSAAKEIFTAIEEAIQEHIYVSPLLASEFLDTVMEKREHREKMNPELSARQREILQLLAEGKSPKEIAAVLNISVRTVEFHKYRIMEATGAKTIAALTRYAIAHGFVHAA